MRKLFSVSLCAAALAFVTGCETSGAAGFVGVIKPVAKTVVGASSIAGAWLDHAKEGVVTIGQTAAKIADAAPTPPATEPEK